MFMKDIGEFLKKVSQEEPSKQIVDSLVTLIGELCAEVNRLNVLVKNLQNEIAQLKNLPPRPKIEPSKLESRTFPIAENDSLQNIASVLHPLFCNNSLVVGTHHTKSTFRTSFPA